MEVQRPDFPSWVVLDQMCRFEDRRSFHADDETSAEAVATTGERVRVAFTLHPLPGSSGLRLYSPEEREESFLDTIVAAHGDAVLLRYEVDFHGLSSKQMHATDYFLYRAGTSGPELSLLPRSYSTEEEVTVAAASDWRTKSRMWNEFSIGLPTAGEDFVVAELEFARWVDSDAPLEAELFRLRSPSSQGEAAGGQWELCRAKSRDCKSKANFRDVLSWETHKVVPYSSYLCWVDYHRGVLFCNVFHGSPDLHYKASKRYLSKTYPPLVLLPLVRTHSGLGIKFSVAGQGRAGAIPRPIGSLATESRTILRCDGIGAYPSDGDAGMASYNIFGNTGFFPSEFSKYLKKLSTRGWPYNPTCQLSLHAPEAASHL
ncbi:hypothetical protein ACQ4PT_056234 [Festuca glaucescens]